MSNVKKNVFDMSLEELMNVPIHGISSMTADKLLILVNGLEINEHTNYGALSERDLPMLTDINHIDVVRGPGSALYGVGALAMVVNIVTENAHTSPGLQVTGRGGVIEEFYSTEVKDGYTFEDGSGLYLYGSTGRNFGSDPAFSPMDSVYPRSWGHVNDQEGYRNLGKYKFHADYQSGPFDIWARFTRGGTRFDKPMHWTTDPYLDDPPDARFDEMGYQQATTTAQYTFDFSDQFKVDTSFSYDMFDSELYYGSGVNSAREDKYLSKVVGRWNPNDGHSLALGTSWSRECFGLRSPGYPGDRYWDGLYHPGCMSMIMVGIPTMPQWHTDTFQEGWMRVSTRASPRVSVVRPAVRTGGLEPFGSAGSCPQQTWPQRTGTIAHAARGSLMMILPFKLDYWCIIGRPRPF